MHDSCYLSALFKSAGPVELHFRGVWTNLSHRVVSELETNLQRQGIQLYSESPLTKRMADLSVKITLLLESGSQDLLQIRDWGRGR